MGDGGCAEGEREKQTRIPDKWISLDWWEGKAPEKWPKDMGRQKVKSLPSEERGGGGGNREENARNEGRDKTRRLGTGKESYKQI